MSISFQNINNHIIQMDKFDLRWRFTEEEYNILPLEHLELIKPYDKIGSKFLDVFINRINLHKSMPFTEGFFKTIDRVNFGLEEEKDVRKWLYHRGFPFDKEVYLSWNEAHSLKTTWKILIKYFDDFFYPGPDDLTVFDESLNWAILFFHESEIYFGTNEKYDPNRVKIVANNR